MTDKELKALVEVCPWTMRNADDCSMQDAASSEEHTEWHLEREVRLGSLVKNEDGTYSAKE